MQILWFCPLDILLTVEQIGRISSKRDRDEFGTWTIVLDASLCWTHHAIIGKYLHIVHRTAELLCDLPSDAAYSLIAVGLHTQMRKYIFCIHIRQSKSQSESTNTKQIPVFVTITFSAHWLARHHTSMHFNAPNMENVYQGSAFNLQFVIRCLNVCVVTARMKCFVFSKCVWRYLQGECVFGRFVCDVKCNRMAVERCSMR